MSNNVDMIVTLTVVQLEELIRNVVSVELQKQNSSTPTGTETESDELLTRDAVSKMLKVSFPTLWSWNKNGILVAKKIGSRVYYEKADVLAQLRKK
jgi:hypothetical protein